MRRVQTRRVCVARPTRWLITLSCLALASQCAALAPNHFLGTCLDDAWVASMKIDNTERDAQGRLVYPFLQPALKYPRYQLRDVRTAAAGVYADTCMPDGAVIYGAGAQVGNNGVVTNKGKINGTVVVELSGWTSHTLTTLVFSILLQEVYGYEVSHYYVTNTVGLTQRMSSVNAGRCTPTHLNLEVWIAGIEAALQVYANESYSAGGIGYFGRSGLYTTNQFIRDGLDATKHSPIIYADYWKSYKYDNNLITSVPVSSLRNNSKFFPPADIGCVDGSFGCKDACSKTKACTIRERTGGECLVVVMMYDYYDPGYLQAVFANNDIPAYFCFLGYDGAQTYALAMQAANKPVLFYHFEPDLFHFNHPGLFDRIFLPRSVPERVVLATGTFGEYGYGETTDNPVDVDFPMTKLSKYAASLVAGQVIEPLLSKFSLSELNMNDLLRKYLASSRDATELDPSFRAACTWLKENYAIWHLWLDRLPLCTFAAHMQSHVTGCSNDSDARTITFAWKTPHPSNASRPYDCDGGVVELPSPIITSRTCDWIQQDERRWIGWIDAQPVCDASFYAYNVSDCDAASKRTVQYYWLLSKPNDATTSRECHDGVALPSSLTVDCEFTPHSSPVFVTIVVIALVLAAVLVLAIVFVYRNRAVPIIKRSQFELLLFMIVGGLLICGAAVAYAGEPTYVLCAIRPILVSTGFTTIFGALVVKSLRVYRVFLRSSMKRVTITTRMMFKFLSIFYVVDTVLFASWFGLAFPTPTTTRVDAIEFDGYVDRVYCQSSSFIFTALLMFWKAILLFLGLYISFLIRNVSADFQESTWIFASAMVVLVGSIVVLPLGYLVQMAAAPFYVFLASSFLLCTALVMGFMLVPKLFRLSEQLRMSDMSSSNTYAKRKSQSGVISKTATSKRYDDNSSDIGNNSTTMGSQVRPVPSSVKIGAASLSRHGSKM